MIEKTSERLVEAANHLGVGKDVFDDSRNIMNELKKMELTEQERFVAADKILSVPHRLIVSSYAEESDFEEEESDFEQENAGDGESSGIVVDEVIENKDNNEPPMVQVLHQPLPIDLIGNTMKVDGRKSRKKKNVALTWQVMEHELQLFVNWVFPTDRERREIEMLNKTAEASSDFIIPLFKFQKEWLAWALDQENNFRGGVLADETGMGKTIQAIALVLAKREPQCLPSSSVVLPLVRGTLVICPVVAVTQWADEIEWCTLKESTNVLVYHGADKTKNWKPFSEYDFVITSYSIVESNWHERNCEGPSVVRQEKPSKQVKENKTNAMPSLYAVKWQRIILDEAHYMKDKRSNTTQAVFALESTYKWALSGTLFPSRQGELYHVIRFLQIDPYSYYFCEHCNCKVLHHRSGLCSDCSHSSGDHFNWWNKYIAKPIESSPSNDVCAKNAMILLKHKILKDLVLRRTKIGRAADLELPPTTVSVRRDFLDREELNYYETFYKEVEAKLNRYVGENAIRLRRREILALIVQLYKVTDHRYLVDFSQSEELSAENLACNAADKQESSICHEPQEDPVDLTSNEDIRGQDDKTMIKYFRSLRILRKIGLENFQTSTKIEALREEIRFMIERDGSAKGIVFGKFSPFLDLIYYSLYKSGVSCVMLNGSMSQAAQDDVVKRFNVEPDCRILLMTFMASGIPLSLTVASHVFIMNSCCSPAFELQALGRIQRIGQYKPTRVVKFVIANTVEEEILNILERRKLIAQGILNGSSEAMEEQLSIGKLNIKWIADYIIQVE
ncbi:ATP-dependent helicase rhp16-like [Vicia villosa]|uniref:ATP-dependent helicase rhp16-like n=1 Tax=Vicia villosa TaxID=3911 RepID=UPI00273B81FF|nr:ATP-dependent helicase rhp16-like [Vicia villosa]